MSQHQQQQQHHTRNGSNGGRKALPPHARPSKPPPLRRGASYNRPQSSHGHNHHAHQSHTPTKATGTGPGWSKKIGAGVVPEAEGQYIEDEESGMASFLQFCTTCEKQIVTPNATLLYCSEACRKRDSVSRPTSIQSIDSIKSPTSTLSTASSYFDHPPADIVPQRSPTVLRPVSLTFSDMSPWDSTDVSDNMDCHNDTSRYLQQFYTSEFTRAQQYSHRPRMSRAPTATDSSNIPSLSHSPSSSYGTVASNASFRPFPRHQPYSTHSTKSIDLVLPHSIKDHPSPTQLLKDASLKSSASTSTAFRVAEAGDIAYEKRRSSKSGSRKGYSEQSANQQLRQLFCHDAMQAAPKHD